MATVASLSTSSFAEGAISLTKPAGLAEGDLMLAIISYQNNESITTPSGWTDVLNSTNTWSGNIEVSAFRKVATSADVAASSFSFDVADTTGQLAGVLYRITDFNSTNIVGSTQSANDTSISSSSRSYTLTLTPAQINSIFFVAHTTNDTDLVTSVSSTGSPTWTEDLDIVFSTTNTFWVGRAVYPSTSQITNFSATLAASGTNVGQIYIFEIRTLVNGLGTAALHSADADFFAPTASSGTSGTANLLSADADFSAPTAKVTTSPTQWTPVTKSTTTWTPITKS